VISRALQDSQSFISPGETYLELAIKALGQFLKRRAITIVPFTIAGTPTSPSLSLDLDGKRKM